ncbi:MAG: hypothetical protein WDN31_05235 [Hyphomicrobium sp.]
MSRDQWVAESPPEGTLRIDEAVTELFGGLPPQEGLTVPDLGEVAPDDDRLPKWQSLDWHRQHLSPTYLKGLPERADPFFWSVRQHYLLTAPGRIATALTSDPSTRDHLNCWFRRDGGLARVTYSQLREEAADLNRTVRISIFLSQYPDDSPLHGQTLFLKRDEWDGWRDRSLRSPKNGRVTNTVRPSEIVGILLPAMKAMKEAGEMQVQEYWMQYATGFLSPRTFSEKARWRPAWGDPSLALYKFGKGEKPKAAKSNPA